jgi:hypothetical protein
MKRKEFHIQLIKRTSSALSGGGNLARGEPCMHLKIQSKFLLFEKIRNSN